MRPPEEVKQHIVRQWLQKAEADMDAADDLLSGERLSLFPSCFHSQQAAEKFLNDPEELMEIAASHWGRSDDPGKGYEANLAAAKEMLKRSNLAGAYVHAKEIGLS